MKKLIFLLCALGMAVSSWAYSFTTNGIYYNITSSDAPYTAAVTYATTSYNSYSGAITIPDSVTNAATGTKYAVTAIGDHAFSSCTGLTSVTIPPSVISIQTFAFESCVRLTSIALPSLLATIEPYIFYKCMSLTSVTIPASVSVSSIPVGAFEYCTKLTSIVIPSSVTAINEDAFYNCSSLNSVSIPSSVTSISNYVFYNCTSLDSITIPSSVTTMANSAFVNCTGLISVTLSSSMPVIPAALFSNCSKLASITIPSSVTGIELDAFSNCTSLASITIPSSVAYIGNTVFAGCSNLTSLSIPANMFSIGDYAFQYCSKLSNIYAYSTAPISLTYSAQVFRTVDTTTCTLHVPKGSLDAYKAADVWKGFTNIVDDLNTTTGKTEAATAAIKVTVLNGQAVITGAEAGTELNVYNLQGIAIYSGKTSGEPQSIPLPAHGVYIVQLGGKSVKVIY